MKKFLLLLFLAMPLMSYAQKSYIHIYVSNYLGHGEDGEYGQTMSLTGDIPNGINYQILSARELGEDTLVHEIGHAVNRKDPTKITDEQFNIIKNRLSGSINNVKEARAGSQLNTRDREIIPLLKSDSRAIKQEERNATKNGIKLLRIVGANHSQIKESKRSLKIAGKTYDINDIAWKSAERDRLNAKMGGSTETNYRDDLKEMRERSEKRKR